LKRALISVWDKKDILEISTFLIKNNFEIISTGGTKKKLIENGIKVTSISEVTGAEEMMDGRVKTLHPKIFGGILADVNNISHLEDLSKIGSKTIDLIIVNLYPFEEMSSKNIPFNELIEYIDIGGPSMLRAAAKNYNSVMTLCNPDLYTDFMIEFSKTNGEISLESKKKYASKVFLETSKYDSLIYNQFSKNDDSNSLSNAININLNKSFDLRYGENPDQKASFYTDRTSSCWEQLSGKKLSYNNFFDMESAISIVKEFNETCCCIIKHANPCGFAIGENLLESFEKAVSCDPISYFGGIVAFNKKIDSKVAKKLIEPFLECIICPDIDAEALNILKMKKNLRIIIYNTKFDFKDISVRSVMGGFLSQTLSNKIKDNDSWKIVTTEKPSQNHINAMKLGWKIVKYIKSNAIVIANEKQILGVGAGQMSRIDSVKIAIQKIKENNLDIDNAVLASDAFFPFSDSIEIANKFGIKHFIQTGGSIKDKEIIKVANKLKVSMIFTNQRLFFH
jgi:phosphoribosylaminoimidazolecarboxamide formyltransferase/IMP cyclohydrolase